MEIKTLLYSHSKYFFIKKFIKLIYTFHIYFLTNFSFYPHSSTLKILFVFKKIKSDKLFKEEGSIIKVSAEGDH